MKYWDIIADKLSKAGWRWGCVSAVDAHGRTIFIADAHRDDGNRFVVRADEKLTALVELQRAIHGFAMSLTTESGWPPSDYVAAESPKIPVTARVDEIEHEGCIPGLDFDQKLIVTIDELLVFEQAGIRVNEHTPPGG